MLFIITLILILLLLAVFWFDATRFIIPNWLVGLIALPYPLYLWLSPVPIDWLWALGIAAIAFVIGLILFATRIMGGGDVKLLTICCLWAGKSAIVDYVILTALLGGALSIFLLAGRPIAGYLWLKWVKTDTMPRLFKKGAPAPYGLAIAGALIILIVTAKLPGLTALVS